MSEKELISGLLAGHKSALTHYYRHFSPEIRAYLSLRINDLKDRDEILQDIFMASLEGLRDFSGRASLRTYLYAISGHKISDYYRKKKLHQIVFSRMPAFEAFLSPLLTPEERFDKKELKRKVDKALKNIIPKYRLLLEAKYMDGKSLQDIAGSMTVSSKSVESMMTRARKSFVLEFEKLA